MRRVRTPYMVRAMATRSISTPAEGRPRALRLISRNSASWSPSRLSPASKARKPSASADSSIGRPVANATSWPA
ncbi:hypothetical protein SDIAM103S_05654 [Streptomyces diastaticus subsp. diastaticus]